MASSSHKPRPGTQKDVSTSWLVRGLTLSAAGAKVAGSLAADSARHWFAPGFESEDARQSSRGSETGLELARSLGLLKGVAVKLGQVASYVGGALPVPVQTALESLQSHVPPMSAEVAERVVTDSLGEQPSVLFAQWEREAFAAASIGQVHRARLKDGTPVAVKVQYPGIVQAVRSDLKNLAVLRLIAAASGTSTASTKAMLEELRTRLLEECDYRKELENQQTFAALWAGRPEVHIPRAFPELCSERVLTSEYVEGSALKAFIETASQPEMDRAGESIFRVAFESIFRHHIFNCDPHPGNYIFRSGNVTFLDFGCVQRFRAERVRAWRSLIRSVLEDDRRSYREALLVIGFAREGREFDYDRQFRISQYLYAPWLRDEVFRYDQEYVSSSFQVMIKGNSNLRNLRIPPDFVFINRLQWGLNSVLAALKAGANWHRILVPLIWDAPVESDERALTPGVSGPLFGSNPSAVQSITGEI